VRKGIASRKERGGRKGASRKDRAAQRARAGGKGRESSAGRTAHEVVVAARRWVAPKVQLPRPSPAELRLLALAQEIAELARNGDGSQALSAALTRLAAEYGPSAPLPAEALQAWVRSRGDKTATLALAWAREQVRLGLQEVVERTRKGARGRVDVDTETFAWLLLAGCEALAQEPPSAVPDRLRALLQLIEHAPASG